MNILHITVHMGGGIGNALSDLTVWDSNSHRVLLLQRPEKKFFIDKCSSKGVVVDICPNKRKIDFAMEWADVVIVHWWHNPILYSFLPLLSKVEKRIVLWSHVSGCNYPYLAPCFVNCFDALMCTSKCTFDNSFWKEEVCKINVQSYVVYGQGRFRECRIKPTYTINEKKIIIGYVGTFSRSKMNPLFVEYCCRVIKEYPNAYFVLVGDEESGEWIREEAKERGILDHIHFTGYTNDVGKYLMEMDVFGYPLNPYNYATTENTILEALMTGVPTVLLNQGTEKYIIDNERNGLLATDMRDFSNCICRLISDGVLREKIGRQAIVDVQKKFCYEDNLKMFNLVMNEVLMIKPRVHSFSDVIGVKPIDWLRLGMNCRDKSLLDKAEYDKLPYIFFEKSKSSIFHFYKCYPKDVDLASLVKKMQDNGLLGGCE